MFYIYLDYFDWFVAGALKPDPLLAACSWWVLGDSSLRLSGLSFPSIHMPFSLLHTFWSIYRFAHAQWLHVCHACHPSLPDLPRTLAWFASLPSLRLVSLGFPLIKRLASAQTRVLCCFTQTIPLLSEDFTLVLFPLSLFRQTVVSPLFVFFAVYSGHAPFLGWIPHRCASPDL